MPGSLLVNLAARSGRTWSGKVALRPLALSLPGGPVFLEGLALSREGLQSSGPGPRLASPRGGFWTSGSPRAQTLKWTKMERHTPCWKFGRVWSPLSRHSGVGVLWTLDFCFNHPPTTILFQKLRVFGLQATKVKIWPCLELCWILSPKLKALHYHLYYYLLNIFPFVDSS